MALHLRVTDPRRVVALLVLALVLLSAPFWIGQFGLDERVVTYERTEVGVEDGEIQYVGSDDRPHGRFPISDLIGCTSYQDPRDGRLCAFEGALEARNHTVIMGYTPNPGQNGSYASRYPYRYLAVNDGVYRPTVNTANSTEFVPDLGYDLYPMYLSLEPVDPETALDRASTRADSVGVAGPVRRAARSGRSTTRGEVYVPPRPIALENGSYYRVYRSDVSDPPLRDVLPHWIARYLAPLLGLVALYAISRTVRLGE